MRSIRRTVPILAAGVLAFVLAAPRPAYADLSPKNIYKHYAPAVVLIMAIDESGQGELGTGSVLDGTGRIITNAHVIIRKSTGKPFPRLRVYFKPGRVSGDPKRDLQNPIQAAAVAWDSKLDLAVLQLESVPEHIQVMPVGDADAVEPGDEVIAIGHPEQGGLWTLTSGVVSTIIANLGGVAGKDAFQTDASINRGNSGGPLISRKGAMIGVNTSMARKAADGLTITAVNFSVKSNVVKDWLASAGVPADYTELAAAEEATGGAPAAAPAAKPKPVAAKPEPKPAAVEPQPKPIVKKPEPKAPAQVEPVEEEVVKTAPRRRQSLAEEMQGKILTKKQPFDIDSMIQREIAEMEDLETEMRGEIDKRRDAINQPDWDFDKGQ